MTTSAARRLAALLGAGALAALAAAAAPAAQAPGVQANGLPAGAPKPPGQNVNGMHIFLQAGLKSHWAGAHDYPQFLADWSKLLTAHGAVVDGALHPPSAEDLAHTDVLVIYKGDAGFMTAEERAALDAYVKRGGGIVSIHDSLCGPDPVYFASLVGGAKRHGQVNYTLDAPISYHVTAPTSPIMRGFSDMTLPDDEAFFNMTWAPGGVHVLATTAIPATRSAAGHVGEVVPQIWTYQHTVAGGEPARAFVWMQGHVYKDFDDPHIQAMLMRGIAWAAKRPVDALVDYTPAPPIQPPGMAPPPG